MKRQISIRIYPDGTVKAETHGIKGAKCTDYIKVLEKLIEGEIVDSEFTSEYFEKESVDINEKSELRLRGGK